MHLRPLIAKANAILAKTLPTDRLLRDDAIASLGQGMVNAYEWGTQNGVPTYQILSFLNFITCHLRDRIESLTRHKENSTRIMEEVDCILDALQQGMISLLSNKTTPERNGLSQTKRPLK